MRSFYFTLLHSAYFLWARQEEILDATRKIIEDVKNNNLDEPITRELFNKYLYQELPPVDYVIRTSGENRLSGFMLWQSSYAEFYFPRVYFPDFDESISFAILSICTSVYTLHPQ